jgi:hypothetical protein
MVRERRNRAVCFIGGAGHSGSTLVGMILGSHPEAFYAGEAGKSRYLQDARKDARKRTCKLCGPACPVWSDFQARDDIDVYEQLSEKTGRPIIIDSTKTLSWIEERIADLEAAGARSVFIFLQRDGRAVINSRTRKYPDRSPVEIIEDWIVKVRRTTVFYEALRHPKMIVRYEELATEPERVIPEISTFLGINFVPEMLEFYRHEHHPLGGNNGTQFIVARHQGPNPDRPYARLGDRSREYYENHASGIHLDLRWKTELGTDVVRLFDEVAGPVNAPLRWEG